MTVKNAGWISVKDELPKRDPEISWTSEYVLISANNLIGIGHYDFDLKNWTYTLCGKAEEDDSYSVTHWQPAPQPPKGS